MNDKIRAALQQTLADGENVLWESGTQPFGIFDGKEGKRTLLRWVISGLCFGALAVVYGVNGGTGFGFYTAVLIIFATLVLAAVFQYRQTSGQYYCLTNRRALTFQKDGTFVEMALDSVDELRLYPLDFGGSAIALGSSLLEEGDKQLSWRASHPERSSESGDFNRVRGMVFYRVERAEEAVRILRGEMARQEG